MQGQKMEQTSFISLRAKLPLEVTIQASKDDHNEVKIKLNEFSLNLMPNLANLDSSSAREAAVRGTTEPSLLQRSLVHRAIMLSGAPFENITSICLWLHRTLIILRSRVNSKT